MLTAIDTHNKAVLIKPVAIYGDITRTAIVIKDGITGNRLWFGSDHEWHIDLESDVTYHYIERVEGLPRRAHGEVWEAAANEEWEAAANEKLAHYGLKLGRFLKTYGRYTLIEA
jgi:hypothetical protein|nr:MAG TPA: hypothetical protein [Caudoviricetes sp.]